MNPQEATIEELLGAVASSGEHDLRFRDPPERKAAWEEIERRLKVAHGGLLRALDYRAGSPEGLNIKADVRDALHASGFTGSMGEQGDSLAQSAATEALEAAIRAASPSERWIAIPHEEWRGLLAAIPHDPDLQPDRFTTRGAKE